MREQLKALASLPQRETLQEIYSKVFRMTWSLPSPRESFIAGFRECKDRTLDLLRASLPQREEAPKPIDVVTAQTTSAIHYTKDSAPKQDGLEAQVTNLVMEIFDWVDWPGDTSEATQAIIRIERLVRTREAARYSAGIKAMEVHLEECLSGRIEPENPTVQLLNDFADARERELREALEGLAAKCSKNGYYEVAIELRALLAGAAQRGKESAP